MLTSRFHYFDSVALVARSFRRRPLLPHLALSDRYKAALSFSIHFTLQQQYMLSLCFQSIHTTSRRPSPCRHITFPRGSRAKRSITGDASKGAGFPLARHRASSSGNGNVSCQAIGAGGRCRPCCCRCVVSSCFLPLLFFLSFFFFSYVVVAAFPICPAAASLSCSCSP